MKLIFRNYRVWTPDRENGFYYKNSIKGSSGEIPVGIGYDFVNPSNFIYRPFIGCCSPTNS